MKLELLLAKKRKGSEFICYLLRKEVTVVKETSQRELITEAKRYLKVSDVRHKLIGKEPLVIQLLGIQQFIYISEIE